MTAIPSLEKQFEEKLENNELVLTDIWERASSKRADLPSVSAVNELITKMSQATEMVCMTSNVKLPKAILHEIASLGKKGIRFYLLVNQYYPEYESFLTKNALVRVDRHINGLTLLIDAKTGSANKAGYLFTYNSFETEKGAISPYVPFNGNQLKEAFHYFLWKFWDSMEEYRDGQTFSASQLRAPFDVLPLLEPEAYFFNADGGGYLKDKVVAMLSSAEFSIHLSLAAYREYDVVFEILNQKAAQGVEIYLYTDFKHDHLFIKRFESVENIYIYSNDILNSYFLIVDVEKGLFLTGSLENTHEAGIMLNQKEVQDLLSNLAYQHDDFWKYYPRVSLGELKHDEIIREKYERKADKVTIERNIVIDQGVFEARNLREFFEANFKPERKSEPILARQIVYRWKLKPKYRDANMKLDPLYEQWGKAVKKIEDHLAKVLEYSISTKNEKRDLLSTFIGRFLSTKEDKLTKVINDLEAAQKSLKVEKNTAVNLEGLIATLKNHSKLLLEEKMEMAEKRQFHEDKQKWEEEKNRLDKEQLSLLRTIDELKRKKDDLRKLENADQDENQGEITRLEEKLLEIVLEIDGLKESNQDFFEKYKVEKVILEICKVLDEKIKKFDQLNKKKKKDYFQKEVKATVLQKLEELNLKPIYDEIMSICKIQDSKGIMSYLKKELATRPEFRTGEQDDKDLIQQLEALENSRIEAEMQLRVISSEKGKQNQEQDKKEKELDKEIAKKEDELRIAERKLEKHGVEFVFSSKIQETQLPFPINPSFSLPAEELPEVGTLYRNGKGRQLAINGLTELEAGEQEAERLKAELVLEIQ